MYITYLMSSNTPNDTFIAASPLKKHSAFRSHFTLITIQRHKGPSSQRKTSRVKDLLDIEAIVHDFGDAVSLKNGELQKMDERIYDSSMQHGETVIIF